MLLPPDDWKLSVILEQGDAFGVRKDTGFCMYICLNSCSGFYPVMVLCYSCVWWLGPVIQALGSWETEVELPEIWESLLQTSSPIFITSKTKQLNKRSVSSTNLSRAAKYILKMWVRALSLSNTISKKISELLECRRCQMFVILKEKGFINTSHYLEEHPRGQSWSSVFSSIITLNLYNKLQGRCNSP